MKNILKNILFSIFSLTLIFNFSYSQFGDDFDLECPSCVTVPDPDPIYTNPTTNNPVEIDCGDGIFVTVPYSCPVNNTPVYTSPTNNNNPVYTNSPTYNNAPVYTGSVNVTYSPTPITNWGGGNGYTTTYKPSPVYTTPTPSTPYTPPAITNWGGGNGYTQVYKPSPVYNTPTPAPVAYVPPAPTIWGGGNGYTQTYYNTPTAPRVVCPANYNVSGQNCLPIKKNCKDGGQVNFYEVCTKVCWGGSANGKDIPENENCPSGSSSIQTYATRTQSTTNTYTVNYRNEDSVITTNINQIGLNSARCNALANIHSGLDTNGYFEYGTTRDLGKVTNSGDIGDESILFSNTIANLKPNTTYYCRAVIKNSNGTHRGDIVSFKTLSEAKRYVSTVREEQVKKVSTKVTKVVKSTVICKDSEGNTESLKEGEKLVLLTIENKTNHVYAGETSEYELSYKNKSDLTVNNVLFTVKVPEGMTVISSEDYSIGAENTISVQKNKIKPGEEGVVILKLKADKSLAVGKSLIVSALATYDLLDENNNEISDESSTYIISTVTDKSLVSSSDNGSSQSMFWSGWLFKLLLCIILFVILYILGRNIYKKILHKRHSANVLGHH